MSAALHLYPLSSLLHKLPWEVSVQKEDGYQYVYLAFLFAIVFHTVAKVIVGKILGRKGVLSLKSGLAPRISTKLVSVLFDVFALFASLKQIHLPEAAVIEDKLYGYSSHSQFHFSLAAGYFAWAGVMTLMYRGQKIAIAHHFLTASLFIMALSPFCHHIGNIYLLFQSSTLILNVGQLHNLFTRTNSKKTSVTQRVLKALHPIVFTLVRIVVGVPLSVMFLKDMINLLASGSAHSVPVVLFFIAVNLLINTLNLYWCYTMLTTGGNGSKPVCSMTSVSSKDGEKKVMRWFDIVFSISFGEREVPHKRGLKADGKKVDDSSSDEVKSNKYMSPIAIVGLASVLAKSINDNKVSPIIDFSKNIAAPLALLKDKVTALSLLNLKGFVLSVTGCIVSLLGSSDTFDLIFNFCKFPTIVFATVYVAFKILCFIGPGKIFDEMDYGDHLYTRIRGNWYDLATFKHPGGPVALNLIKGRDGTALYYSHHYLMDFKILNNILKKFLIQPEDVIKLGLKTLDSRDDDVDGGVFIWDDYENDPFTLGIKKMIVDHFRPVAKAQGVSLRESTKMSWNRTMMILGLSYLFFGLVPYFVAGNYYALIAQPLLCWLVSVNYWHDGLHFSLSTDWRINALAPYVFPYLCSTWMWYHQHVIGHHAYTNVAHKDPDLAHAPGIMREHSSIKWKPAHLRQHGWATFAFVWSVGVGWGMQVFSDIKANSSGAYNSAVAYAPLSRKRLILHVLGRMLYVWCAFVWPYFSFSPFKAFLFASVPISIYSWCFMLNSQINHLTPNTAHASSTHFLKHQIVTAQDFGNQSKFCEFMSGGLNMQIEHHCFPCLNHCHLKTIQPKLEALCKEHNVNYWKVDGYREAFRLHCEHTEAMGIFPFSEGHEH